MSDTNDPFPLSSPVLANNVAGPSDPAADPLPDDDLLIPDGTGPHQNPPALPLDLRTTGPHQHPG